MRAFKLDDVEIAREPAVTRSLASSLGDVLCLGAEPATQIVELHGAHPLIGAVHVAFAEHRPLRLSPDVVWLTIAQGVAQHVRLNADTLRSRLVRHQGRETIDVTHDGPMPRNERGAWDTIVHGFRESIASRVGEGIARLFACDFTTTTLAERVASEIVLMDAVSPYFDFHLSCVCGIPEVTLLGTPADWRRIRERVDIIAELGLSTWARSLAAIADHFVLAAEGAPDIPHWKRIYKPREAYGSETITGWIARLYPYVKSAGRVSEPNSLLALPMDEPRDTVVNDPWYLGPGITLHDAPAGLSSARVRVTDQVTGTRHELTFEGGLLGAAFDGRAVSPVAGYVIREHVKGMLDIIEELERAHVTVRATTNTGDVGSADMRVMYDRIESATLFPGEREWRMRTQQEWQLVELALPHGRAEQVSRIIDLPEHRFIAMAFDWNGPGQLYLLCDGSQQPQRAEDVPVVAMSLTALLDQALTLGGGRELPSLGRLIDRIPQWMKDPPPQGR